MNLAENQPLANVCLLCCDSSGNLKKIGGLLFHSKSPLCGLKCKDTPGMLSDGVLGF